MRPAPSCHANVLKRIYSFSFGWLLSAGIASYALANDQTLEPYPIQIEATRAHHANLPIEIYSTCTIQPFRKATLAAQAQGQVAARWIEPGDSVKAGDALIKIDDTEILNRRSQAEARVRAEQAKSRRAKKILEQSQRLAKQNAVSQDNIDQQTIDLESAEANLDLAIAIESDIRRELAYSSIRAPFAGVIQAVHLQVGDFARVGNDAVTLADFSEARLICGLATHDLASIDKASLASVTLNDLNGAQVEGTVSNLAGVTKNSTGTFNAEIRIQDPITQRLRDGMTATANWVAHLSNVLIVPHQALINRGTGFAVFVINRNIAELRPVLIGASNQSQVEILEGIESGDIIATQGQFTLSHGSAVSVDMTELL